MKRLSIWNMLLIMMCSMTLVACSSDDDETPGNTSDLIGLWEEIYTMGWEKENGNIEYEYEHNYEEDGTQGARVEFKADGTYIQYDGWEADIIGTWEYKGNKIYMSYYDEYDETEYTEYVVVKELTSSRLVVESSAQDTFEGTLYEAYSYSINRKVK